MTELAPIGVWHPTKLPSGQWVVSRNVMRGRNLHREVMIGDRGAFVRFDTEAMADLMAGKKNR